MKGKILKPQDTMIPEKHIDVRDVRPQLTDLKEIGKNVLSDFADKTSKKNEEKGLNDAMNRVEKKMKKVNYTNPDAMAVLTEANTTISNESEKGRISLGPVHAKLTFNLLMKNIDEIQREKQ